MVAPAEAEPGGEVPQALTELMRPHIDSFDYFVGPGMAEIVGGLAPVRIGGAAGGGPLRVWIESARVEQPRKGPEDGSEGCIEGRLFPRQCREQGTSYRGAMIADVCRQVCNKKKWGVV